MLIHRGQNQTSLRNAWNSEGQVETIGANGLRVVPTDMSSLDRSLGNMKSICWQRVWRWRFGKASGVEDKPLCRLTCRRPSAPLSRLFYVGRTPPLYVAARPRKRLVIGSLAKIDKSFFIPQLSFWNEAPFPHILSHLCFWWKLYKTYINSWWWGHLTPLRCGGKSTTCVYEQINFAPGKWQM